MSKELKIKSNGLRNELKEIRKSIDKLTNAILMAQSNKHQVFRSYDPPYTITSTSNFPDAQTNTQHETTTSIGVAPDRVHIAKDHDREKDS